MSNKPKKQKSVRNKARDMIGDYYKTNRESERENRRRQEEENDKPKGLKNLNANERVYVIIIVLGLIGILVKYVFF